MLQVKLPSLFLSLVSDEPVFFLHPHQRILKDTGQDRSALKSDSPPLSSHALVHGEQGPGAMLCRWGTISGHSAAGRDGLLKLVPDFKMLLRGLSE